MAGFLKEEQADLVRSQSLANLLHVWDELSLLSQRSFLSPLDAEAVRGYRGRAAILSRERPGAFLAPSHPPLISSVTYRLALLLPAKAKQQTK